MKSLLILLTIFILSLFISHEPERCEHILIKGDAYGITQVWITVCDTHQTQVNAFGEHFTSKRSMDHYNPNQ
jgi:hypothetical protein